MRFKSNFHEILSVQKLFTTREVAVYRDPTGFEQYPPVHILSVSIQNSKLKIHNCFSLLPLTTVLSHRTEIRRAGIPACFFTIVSRIGASPSPATPPGPVHRRLLLVWMPEYAGISAAKVQIPSGFILRYHPKSSELRQTGRGNGSNPQVSMSSDVVASLKIAHSGLSSSKSKPREENNMKTSPNIRTSDTQKVKAIVNLRTTVLVLLAATSLILGYGNGSSPSA